MRHHRIFGASILALLGASLLVGGSATAQAACGLQSADNRIKHVVHIQFDNVHLRRDNPNVPSDLEQMPNLLNFMQNNGVVSGNHHPPLISHTATDILTVLTGAYGDRVGIPVANSYGFFRADGSVGFSSSFLYWTALSADGKPQLINENGKTFPAPWAPFTRAGCDVGAFSIANLEFESLPADVRTVFGPGSPEDQAVTAALALPRTPANAPARQAPNTDYLGIAVHCTQGSPLCNNSHARTDAWHLYRFPGVVRQRERRAGDLCSRARSLQQRQRQGHRWRRHCRRLRPSRLSQHLQPGGEAVARLRRHHARSWYSRRLCLFG